MCSSDLAQRLAQGQGRAHVPAQHGFARHPHLTAKASDQIPHLPAVMADGLVQSGGAVFELTSAGLAIVIAPAEVPVGKGAEPFFSASSSMPGLT